MAKNRWRASRKLWLIVALLIILVIAGIWLIKRHKPAVATIPSTSANSSQNSSQKTTKDASPPSSGTTSGTSQSNTTAANLTLVAPWGDFVSNHSPGAGGSPTSEVSVCNTTPGASCYIQFTMGGLTRNLSAKNTDSNGTASWSWDVKSAGLSSGSWQISAIASLNGQTKTTNDQILLKVQ